MTMGHVHDEAVDFASAIRLLATGLLSSALVNGTVLHHEYQKVPESRPRKEKKLPWMSQFQADLLSRGLKTVFPRPEALLRTPVTYWVEGGRSLIFALAVPVMYSTDMVMQAYSLEEAWGHSANNTGIEMEYVAEQRIIAVDIDRQVKIVPTITFQHRRNFVGSPNLDPTVLEFYVGNLLPLLSI